MVKEGSQLFLFKNRSDQFKALKELLLNYKEDRMILLIDFIDKIKSHLKYVGASNVDIEVNIFVKGNDMYVLTLDDSTPTQDYYLHKLNIKI